MLHHNPANNIELVRSGLTETGQTCTMGWDSMLSTSFESLSPTDSIIVDNMPQRFGYIWSPGCPTTKPCDQVDEILYRHASGFFNYLPPQERQKLVDFALDIRKNMSEYYSMYRCGPQTSSPTADVQLRSDSATPPLPLPFQMAYPPQSQMSQISNHHMPLLESLTDSPPMLKSDSRTATPPMALPFVTSHHPQQQQQHHHPHQQHYPHNNVLVDQHSLTSSFGGESQYNSSFEAVYNWGPASSGPMSSAPAATAMPTTTATSPFLHDMAVQNFPPFGVGTVSPQQLHPELPLHPSQQQHQQQGHIMTGLGGFHQNQDDAGLFTFSDSESSLSDRFVPVSGGPQSQFTTVSSQHHHQSNDNNKRAGGQRHTTSAVTGVGLGVGLGLCQSEQEGFKARPEFQHDRYSSHSRRLLPSFPGHLGTRDNDTRAVNSSTATATRKALPSAKTKKIRINASRSTASSPQNSRASDSAVIDSTAAANNANSSSSRRRGAPRQRQRHSITASPRNKPTGERSQAMQSQPRRHRQRNLSPTPSKLPSPSPSPTPSTCSLSVSFGLPGHDKPGFVPIGCEGAASEAQGNRWPIDRELMMHIIAAERGNCGYVFGEGGGRGEPPLTYRQIKEKYNRWQHKEPTLRGIARSFQRPKEHRERKPTWEAEHIIALHAAIPLCTDEKGKVHWLQVAHFIENETSKPFGAGTVAKKWDEIVNGHLNVDSLPIPAEQRSKKHSKQQQRRRVEDSTDDEDDDEETDNEGESRSLNDEKFQDLSISDGAAAAAAANREN